MPNSFKLNIKKYEAELKSYLPSALSHEISFTATLGGETPEEIEYEYIEGVTDNGESFSYHTPPENATFTLTVSKAIYDCVASGIQFKKIMDTDMYSATYDRAFNPTLSSRIQYIVLKAALECNYRRLGLHNMLDSNLNPCVYYQAIPVNSTDPLINFRAPLIDYETKNRSKSGKNIFSQERIEKLQDYFTLDAMPLNYRLSTSDNKLLPHLTLRNSSLVAVINALDAVNAYKENETDENKAKAIAALKALDKLSKQLPSTRGFKVLGAAMIAVGIALMAVGCIAALVSASLLPTGMFTPLGAIGLPTSIGLAVSGFSLAACGAAIFANCNKVTTIPRALSDTRKQLEAQMRIK